MINLSEKEKQNALNEVRILASIQYLLFLNSSHLEMSILFHTKNHSLKKEHPVFALLWTWQMVEIYTKRL